MDERQDRSGWEDRGKEFLRRFEDKPPYLTLASESHVVVGRAVPNAPGVKGINFMLQLEDKSCASSFSCFVDLFEGDSARWERDYFLR